MTTSPETATRTAEEYLAENRPGCTVAKLYEDRTDYLVEIKTDGPPRVGEAFLFIRKSDGKAWTSAFGSVLDKVYAMTEVA
jgi:hypothetical protein